MATVHMSYLILVYLALSTTIHTFVYLVIGSYSGIPVHWDYCILIYLVIRTTIFWYIWSQGLEYSGIHGHRTAEVEFINVFLMA
jgi:hypothetical protein